jgi:hypothetical protein
MTATPAIIKCTCGEPAKQLTCRKEGPNKGRPFWTCAKRFCNFFESADGKEWIRGRTTNSGTEFHPFKKYRNADSTIKEVYSTLPPEKILPLDSKGIRFMDGILEVKGEERKTAHKILALRVFPCMKIIRNCHGYEIKKKLPPREGAEERKRSTGYKFDVASIDVWNDKGTHWELKYRDARNEECALIIQNFILGLATDPIKTIGEMGKKAGSCCFCGHDLTDPDSIAKGYGSLCAEYFKTEIKQSHL